MRRLSPQLFELAALQSDRQVLHRERINRDEMVADAEQKLELGAQPPPVQLRRSLSNLIDNAPGRTLVRLILCRQGWQAPVLIAEDGPGLPLELAARVNQQDSLRDLPLRRTDGGIGGRSLAIAPRVALLHRGMPAAWRHACCRWRCPRHRVARCCTWRCCWRPEPAQAGWQRLIRPGPAGLVAGPPQCPTRPNSN